MLEDNRKDINKLPLQVIPTTEAINMFGILDTTYNLDGWSKVYLFQEASGIIRSGFTVEFYREFHKFFKIKENDRDKKG